MKNTLLLLTVAATALLPAMGHAQSATPTPTPAATPTSYVAPFVEGKTSALADRQAHTATQVAQRMVGGEAQLLMNYRALYNAVWHNADGLTPQQVCDALGAKATNLFVIAGTMANALYGIDPAGIGALVNVPPGYATHFNADGTVTITSPAPAAATPTPTPAP